MKVIFRATFAKEKRVAGETRARSCDSVISPAERTERVFVPYFRALARAAGGVGPGGAP